MGQTKAFAMDVSYLMGHDGDLPKVVTMMADLQCELLHLRDVVSSDSASDEEKDQAEEALTFFLKLRPVGEVFEGLLESRRQKEDIGRSDEESAVRLEPLAQIPM